MKWGLAASRLGSGLASAVRCPIALQAVVLVAVLDSAPLTWASSFFLASRDMVGWLALESKLEKRHL